MKIAIFTDTYLPEINGVVTSIDNFSKRLAARGHEVLILCPKYISGRDHKEGPIQVRRFRSFSFVTNKNTHLAFVPMGKLFRILREFHPDIIHIQTPLNIGIVGIFAAKALGVKNIQTYHAYLPDFATYLAPAKILGFERLADDIESSRVVNYIINSDFYIRIRGLENEVGPRFFKKLFKGVRRRSPKGRLSQNVVWSFTRTVYNRADLVLTPSRVLGEIIVRHGVTAPVRTQTNGVEIDKILVKKSYKKTGRLIHYGRLGLEKNIEVVLKAFLLAAKKDADLTLDIIGDGPARPMLKKLAARDTNGGRVNFLGFIERTKILKFLKRYDAFLTASPMETQGLVVIEAMASGLPVIGANKLAIPEVVKNGVNGYLIPVGDFQKMAKQILKLEDSVENRKLFGENGIKKAAEHNIEAATDHLIYLYHSVRGF